MPLFGLTDSSSHATRLRRKIDRKLIPILILIYIATFIDRVNFSNALVLGLPEDLNLHGSDTNIALASSAAYLVQVLGPGSSWIDLTDWAPVALVSTTLLTFGIIMIGQGFVKDYASLVVTRVLLGIAESGIFPGCFYLISMWYKREDAQKRFTAFYCSAGLSQSFGGVLAGAIATMNGTANISGWRWIFIIEGICTCAIACLAFALVIDFPDQATWLTAEEKQILQADHQDGAAMIADEISFTQVGSLFRTPKPYLGAFMYFGMLVPSYALAYFIPTVINDLGYSAVQTQLHTVPPIAAGLLWSIILAIMSDKAGLRYPFVLFSSLLTLLGSLMLMNIHEQFRSQYAGLTLVSMGCQSALPGIVCWFTMNLSGHKQRSVGAAWLIGCGNFAGILATFVFLARERPIYTTGYSVTVGCTVVSGLASLGYLGVLLNERRFAGRGLGI